VDVVDGEEKRKRRGGRYGERSDERVDSIATI